MLTPTSPGNVGAFKDLAGVTGDGLTPHHMPRQDGGCKVLTHEDHVKT